MFIMLITSYISAHYYLQHLHLPTSYHCTLRTFGIDLQQVSRPYYTRWVYIVRRTTQHCRRNSGRRFPRFVTATHRTVVGHIIIRPPRRRRRRRTRQITRERTSCGLQNIHSHDTATASFRPSHCRV